MTQLALFAAPPAPPADRPRRPDPAPLAGFQRHSPTSKAGAEAVAPVRAGLQGLVLAAFEAAGAAGLIVDELADRLAATGRWTKETSINVRVAELRRANLIHATQRTREGRSGLQRTVYAAGPDPDQAADAAEVLTA
ncbi:MAG: hypothetical protein AB1716_11405 [Planctomycetota bacterium]